MELYLSNSWYLINPREIRSIRYFQSFKDKEYSPDKSFDEILNDISSGNANFWKKDSGERPKFDTIQPVYVDLSDEEKNKLKDKIRKEIKKVIQIEMYDRTDQNGHKYPNVLQVNVGNDELFNYIYQNLSRKFGLRLRNKKLEEEKVIKLYKKELSKEEISEILNLKYTLVEKIIEEYKSKTNGT